MNEVGKSALILNVCTAVSLGTSNTWSIGPNLMGGARYGITGIACGGNAYFGGKKREEQKQDPELKNLACVG